MTTTMLPPTRGLPEDDLDRVLFAYFKHEMPDPWPNLPIPAGNVRPASAAPVPHRRSGRDARFALAASVAMIVGSCWYLADHMPSSLPERPENVTGGVATKPRILHPDRSTAKDGSGPVLPAPTPNDK
jgi:hypothetical protein